MTNVLVNKLPPIFIHATPHPSVSCSHAHTHIHTKNHENTRGLWRKKKRFRRNRRELE